MHESQWIRVNNCARVELTVPDAESISLSEQRPAVQVNDSHVYYHPDDAFASAIRCCHFAERSVDAVPHSAGQRGCYVVKFVAYCRRRGAIAAGGLVRDGFRDRWWPPCCRRCCNLLVPLAFKEEEASRPRLIERD